MSDESQVNDQEGMENMDPAASQKEGQQGSSRSNDEFMKLVEEQVQAQLAPIKEKLDKAYNERDEARKAASRLEEEAKKARLETLESEGKEMEALQLRYSDLEGRYDAIREENIRLTRDQKVMEATTGLDFRNESAKSMAVREITNQLVQDSDGNWIHKSGVDIRTYVESYAKDDDKSFLFKPKTSSGAQSMGMPSAGNVDAKAPYMTKPISELTSSEMLQAVQAGRFGEVSEEMAMQSILGG